MICERCGRVDNEADRPHMHVNNPEKWTEYGRPGSAWSVSLHKDGKHAVINCRRAMQGLAIPFDAAQRIIESLVLEGHPETLDKKAIKIDPRESFSVPIIATPTLLAKLKKAAKPDCPTCFGQGLRDDGAGGLRMCECLKV